MLETATRIMHRAGVISAGSGSHAAAAAAAAAGQGKAELLLVAGRALHAAASALLQLHEPSAAAVQAAAAHPELQLLKEEPMLVANAPVTLRAVVDCVASISLLLPATAAGRSTGTTPQYLAELQQLLQQLQSPLGAVVPVAHSSHDGRRFLSDVRGYEDLLKELFPIAVVRQLLQLATVICTQVTAPGPLCCANPGCTILSRLSERELVSGRGTVCSGCHAVRLCSTECNKAFWKAGHKKACKRLPEEAGQQQAGGGSKSSSTAGISSSSSRSIRTSAAGSSAGTCAGAGSSSSSTKRSSSGGSSQGVSARSSVSDVPPSHDQGTGEGSSSANAAASAGLQLPGSAAAAAALSVRQLKALLAGLGVGCGAALEKSDLVGALVAQLQLT
jgi:hypothetical protein